MKILAARRLHAEFKRNDYDLTEEDFTPERIFSLIPTYEDKGKCK